MSSKDGMPIFQLTPLILAMALRLLSGTLAYRGGLNAVLALALTTVVCFVSYKAIQTIAVIVKDIIVETHTELVWMAKVETTGLWPDDGPPDCLAKDSWQ